MKRSLLALLVLIGTSSLASAQSIVHICGRRPPRQSVPLIPDIPEDPGIPPQLEIPAPPAAIVPTPEELRGEPPALLSPSQLRREPPALPAPQQLMRERPAVPPPAALRRQQPALRLPRRSEARATHRVVLAGDEARVVYLLDRARRAKGLSTLRIDPLATQVARAHSADMCRQHFFDHKNPQGQAPWDRLRAGGVRFSAAAENIAVGYRSAFGVHEGWMKSPGHRENRMSARYSRIGVGKVVCGSTVYWTEVFMR